MTPIYNSLKAPREKKAGRKGGKKKKKKLTRSQCAHIPVKGRKNRGETPSSISLALLFFRQRSR
jgi:hypothetical protein